MPALEKISKIMKDHDTLGIPIDKETKDRLLTFIRRFEKQNTFEKEKIEKFEGELRSLRGIEVNVAPTSTKGQILDIMDNIKRIIDSQKKAADRIRNFTERI